MTRMSITYLRNRAREMRHADTELEYQDLLEKLARHLNIVSAEESLTLAHKRKVITKLRQLGISASRITYHS